MALHQLEPYRAGRDAIAVARNLVEQPRDPGKNGPNDGGSAQRSGRSRWAEILTRYELWDDLIAATTTGALDWSKIPLEQEQKAYTLGLAYAAKNEQPKLDGADRDPKEAEFSRSQVRTGRAGGPAAPRSRRHRARVRVLRKSHLDADRGSGPGPTEGAGTLGSRRRRPARPSRGTPTRWHRWRPRS